MTAVVRRLASSVPSGEGLNLSDKMMTSTPPEQIGRMMSGLEAELILRLVQGRGRPREYDWPPFPAPRTVIENAESFWVEDAGG